MKIVRIALAQINPTVGDLAGNIQKIKKYIKKAKARSVGIVAFPELAVTGYPPEDLVHKPQFISDNISAIQKLAGEVAGITAIIGFLDRGEKGEIFNAAAVISGGRVVDVYHKILLPNYGVFDEVRYFTPGNRYPVYELGGVRFAINICEDVWHHHGPAQVQSLAGAEIIININASPYEKGKPETREKVLSDRSSENSIVIAYLNAVGGQDELVFDGLSMVYDHSGRLIARGRQFEEELMVVDVDISRTRKYRKCSPSLCRGIPAEKTGGLIKIPSGSAGRSGKKIAPERLPGPTVISSRMDRDEEIYRALVMGTSDYVRKNGFNGVVIGLSGGVDSSFVATIAADAIGSENVTGLFMPSGYTSNESREDAFGLAKNLSINIIELSIGSVLGGYLKTLEKDFRGKEKDTTEENLQARIRGNLLMAFSNKFGWLVLTTGNKSEMSVGYATLYGDMAGGFAVIKDVPKTLVYDLCRWRNSNKGAVIPDRVLWKEPTAELKPGQKDTDSLPPYPVLDPILKAYVEEELCFDEILRLGSEIGCSEDVIRKVISMVDRSEYKRRQSPPGVKITARAFGRDRRFPITNRYRSY